MRYEFGGLHCNNSVLSNEQVKSLCELAAVLNTDQKTINIIANRAQDYNEMWRYLMTFGASGRYFGGDKIERVILPGVGEYQWHADDKPRGPKRTPKLKKPKNKTAYRRI